MRILILRLQLGRADMAAVRQHARAVGDALQMETLRATRFTTAVSEIARNACEFAGGGTLDFLVDTGEGRQSLIAQVSDQGPGIDDIDVAWSGRRLPSGRISNGLPGSRKLVDRMTIESAEGGGTVVSMEMYLSSGRPPVSEADLTQITADLSRRHPASLSRELEQQNHELLKIHQELLERQTALEDADARKNQFVATLVHELRTPLSTLTMTLAVLRRKPDLGADELLRRCELMERQTGQLTRLVDELMDVARVSQGKVDLDPEATDLNEMAANAIEMTGGAVAAKGHAITLVRADAPLWVHADRSRLAQVLCNLIQNAARYTPERGEIRLAVQASGNRAVVQVSDNGIGIDRALLPHVFELFVQGDMKPPNSEGGLGIGLTLVQRLVALHGGEVSVESPGPNMGSTFKVALPILRL